MNAKFQAGDIIKNFAGEHMFVVYHNALIGVYDLYYMQKNFNTRDVFVEVVDKECELVQRVNNVPGR